MYLQDAFVSLILWIFSFYAPVPSEKQMIELRSAAFPLSKEMWEQKMLGHQHHAFLLGEISPILKSPNNNHRPAFPDHLEMQSGMRSAIQSLEGEFAHARFLKSEIICIHRTLPEDKRIIGINRYQTTIARISNRIQRIDTLAVDLDQKLMSLVDPCRSAQNVLDDQINHVADIRADYSRRRYLIFRKPRQVILAEYDAMDYYADFLHKMHAYLRLLEHALDKERGATIQIRNDYAEFRRRAELMGVPSGVDSILQLVGIYHATMQSSILNWAAADGTTCENLRDWPRMIDEGKTGDPVNHRLGI